MNDAGGNRLGTLLGNSFMMGLNAISWLFAVLVLIVFCNRYIFGSIARLLDRRTEKGFGADPKIWPRVSIIVPVFNEGRHVLATALSFDQLDYPRDRLEIVFIDDCSTDNTYEYLQMAEAS